MALRVWERGTEVRKSAKPGPIWDSAPARLRDQPLLPAGEFRSKAFRHTYCAARLQTLDRGAPVSIYTVARELGHGSDEMVKRIYAHLGDVRHRAEVVEYRVDQHLERLGDRLQRLGLSGPFVTGNVTTSGARKAGKSPPRPKSRQARRFQRAGDRTRTGDVQLGKLAFYH
jgi:hypothetical protein